MATIGVATGSPDVEASKEQDLTISQTTSPDHKMQFINPDAAQEAISPELAKKRHRAALFSIFCAGFALISDGYQNSLMSATNVALSKQYKKYTANFSTQVSNALIVGEILGQISIGVVCDYLGRKWAILITTALIVIGGILATAASAPTPAGLFWFLTVARGITGFGTGGEYPASSVSATEAANEHTLAQRGRIFLLVTNLPLSIGGPFVLCVFLIVLNAAGQSRLNTTWRICFALGVIWPLSVFYFRWKMLNSKLYRRGAIKRDVPYKLILKYYWRTLIGTCGTWFLFDFIAFPNGVFSGLIIASVVKTKTVEKTLEWSLLLSALSLPGVFLGIYLTGIVRRKYIMMIGFGGYLIFGLIVGLAYDKVINIVPLFVVLYGLMQLLGSLGPGNMLGLLASESYATGVRGTCYGLSAAMGKTGGAIGTEVFTRIQDNLGKRWTFIIAAIAGLAGILITWFFVPDISEEDLIKADEEFRAYLVAHDWHHMMGEDELQALADDRLSVETLNSRALGSKGLEKAYS
ncbi:major facilitator superfamily domain-containing protein [Xylaria sp. CBS 124048]|nr:major facilitator superfamily domain-containing protein [Xylaria sp. CBS 124048]